MILRFTLFFISFSLIFSSCSQNRKKKNRYDNWIDSIEKMDVSKFDNEIFDYPDSVYNSFKGENTELSSTDYQLIQKIQNTRFKSMELSLDEVSNFSFTKHLKNKSNEHFNIRFIPLDILDPFKNYILMIDMNSDWHKTIQFFSKNHKLGEYKASIKTILEAERFDNKTLIIGQVFQSGTGVYWLQQHFFKFTNNRVIPVLQTVSSSYQYGWGCMDYGVDAKIISKNPLKITYEKQMEFRDSLSNVVQKHKRIDTVLFVWNTQKMCYQPATHNDKKSYYNNSSFYVGAKINYLMKSNINWFKPLLKTKVGLSVLNQLYKINN